MTSYTCNGLLWKRPNVSLIEFWAFTKTALNTRLVVHLLPGLLLLWKILGPRTSSPKNFQRRIRSVQHFLNVGSCMMSPHWCWNHLQPRWLITFWMQKSTSPGSIRSLPGLLIPRWYLQHPWRRSTIFFKCVSCSFFLALTPVTFMNGARTWKRNRWRGGKPDGQSSSLNFQK